MNHRGVLLITVLAAATAAPAAAQDVSGSPKLVLYTQTSLTGDSRSIQANFPNLEAIDFDNKARSVRVLAGTWEICAEKNYKRCETVTASVTNLDAIGLSGKISSVRLVHQTVGSTLAAAVALGPAAAPSPTAGPTPRIVFFDKTGFRGDSLALDEPRGNLAGLTARGESVKVIAGTWQCCTGMNYTGSCTVLGADSADLGAWRNRIVSARPVPADPAPRQ